MRDAPAFERRAANGVEAPTVAAAQQPPVRPAQRRAAAQKRRKMCFVVMGFGVKTDLATGRKLDLDKSYKHLIKPAVEAQGIECVRADEVRRSGVIDSPMYELLFSADVVIADLSTANPNALYELGVRHALRPRTTIVVSENKLAYPFDLNHVRIASYAHLGEDIGVGEAKRFRGELRQTLDAVLKDEQVDSPIYTFLKRLQPPKLRRQVEEALEQVAGAAAQAADASLAAAAPGPEDTTVAALVEQGELAAAEERFGEAKALFGRALWLCEPRKGVDGRAPLPDAYLQQRLVFATYKAKQPDELAALDEALALLAPLQPEISNDPETMSLGGAIEKRLYHLGRGSAHLDLAIRYYARGYFLRDDWRNGINLAHMLTLRADKDEANDDERVADLVWANRLRRQVLRLCEQDAADRKAPETPEARAEDGGGQRLQRAFSRAATEAEAHFGLGDTDAFKAARAVAAALDRPGRLLNALDDRLRELKAALGKREHLLSGGTRKR